MKRIFAIASISFAAPSFAADYNLQSDWSEVNNPSGPWVLRQGTNPLPHVANWQLAPWGTAQSGWARSGNTTSALPFFFRSNGTEAFAHDWASGQVVVHTTDPANGVGSGAANILFVVPQTGTLTLSGGTWIGRDIGRAVNWTILLNGTPLTSGSVASGDSYSSTSPFAFATGSGGASAITNINVFANDSLVLQFDTASTNTLGDFVGINLGVSIVPAPGTAALLGLGGLMASGARRRR